MREEPRCCCRQAVVFLVSQHLRDAYLVLLDVLAVSLPSCACCRVLPRVVHLMFPGACRLWHHVLRDVPTTISSSSSSALASKGLLRLVHLVLPGARRPWHSVLRDVPGTIPSSSSSCRCGVLPRVVRLVLLDASTASLPSSGRCRYGVLPRAFRLMLPDACCPWHRVLRDVLTTISSSSSSESCQYGVFPRLVHLVLPDASAACSSCGCSVEVFHAPTRPSRPPHQIDEHIGETPGDSLYARHQVCERCPSGPVKWPPSRTASCCSSGPS